MTHAELVAKALEDPKVLRAYFFLGMLEKRESTEANMRTETQHITVEYINHMEENASNNEIYDAISELRTILREREEDEEMHE